MDLGVGLLSFIVLVFLSCLKILSGLIVKSPGFITCVDNDVYLRLENFDGKRGGGGKEKKR